MASAWERMQQKAKEEQAGRRETAAPAAVASNSAWERMQQKAAVASGAQPASREQRDAGVRESYARRENQAKLDKLRSQHQQLTVDMEFDEAAKVKDEITALEKSMGQHWTDRTVNVLSGAAKQSVGGLSAGISTAYEAGQPGRSAQNEAFRQEQQERYDRAKREYEAMQAANRTKPGSWSEGDLESARNIMEDARRKGEAMGLVIDEQIQQKAATAARDFSRDVMASGGKYVEKAKTGLTGAGKFAVDVGVGAAQLAGDALLGAITAGGSLAPLALRTFGSGAEEARAEGATLGQQLAYGAGSAALGVAAEKLFSVSKPFKKMFGPGLLDNAVAKALGRMGQTPTGKLALSAISEGGEEFLEAVFQPVLQRATYNKDATFDLGDALYQAAVGAALGLAGGGVDVALGGKATGTAQEAPPNAAAQRTGQREGVGMAEQESPAEAPTDPVLRVVLGQQKTAPEVGTEVNVISRQSAINDRSREKNTLAYTLATSIDKVSDMEPVSQLTGREMNEPGKKPSEQIADFFKRFGNKVFRVGFGDVALNDYGVGGMLNHRPLNRAKMVSLAAVPDVIQRGKQIYYDPNWKGRGYPSYIFAAPVTVGNTPVYVAAVVNQNPDNKFYLSEMVDSEGNYVKIEESPSSNSKNGVTDGAGQASGAGITAGPEGLSSGASPSTPNVGIEPVAPVIDSTIAQDADSVNSNTVGAAAAGSVNSDYDNLQQDSSQFHDEGANAARPVDVPMYDADGNPISRFASNMMGAKALPDDVIPMIQQMVADGELSYRRRGNKTTRTKARAAIREKGFDGAMEQLRTAIREGRSDVDTVALGTELLVNAANAGDSNAVAEIASLMQTTSTNVGQAMQYFTVLRKLNPESQLYAIRKTVEQLNERVSPGLEDLQGIEIPQELVEKFLQQTDQNGRDAVMEEIYQAVANQVPATWKDKWDAWRYMAMLTNPRTHIRNIVGNLGFQPVRVVKNKIAAALERVLGVEEKTKSFAVSPVMYRAAWADFDKAGKLLNGNRYTGVQSEIERRRPIFKNKVLEGARKGNSAALDFEDAVFKRITYADALAGYLTANGVKAEQLDGGTVPAELLARARDYAASEALKATYQDDSAAARKVDQLARAMGPAGDALLPFKKTPANILARGFEYSPAGLAKALTVDLAKVQSGEKSVAEALDAVAAGLTGTGLFSLGAYLFAQGLVTGAQGDDEEDKWADLLGHQGYALELPDGTSVTLDWLAPEALPFFMGVEFMSSVGEAGWTADEILSASIEATKAAANPMMELSMLQGVNDLIESVRYAEGAPLAAMIPSIVTSYLSQAVPTVLGQAERSAEEVRMTTYTDKNSEIPKDLQYAIGRASARIPGIDFNQIPYIDAWGREEDSGDTLVRTLNNTLNPAYTSKVEMDAVEAELQRLYDATGETVFPERAEKSFEVEGETKHLTAEEYVKYARAKGTQSQQLLSRITQRSDYQSLSDADKADVVSRVYEYANARAKQQVSNYELSGWVKSAVESGIDIADYIVTGKTYGKVLNSATTGRMIEGGLMSLDEWGAMHSAIYADGTAKKDELVEYITKSFPKEKRSDVYKAFIGNRNWGNPF